MKKGSTEKYAFRMMLNPGCADEYQRRHDALWPELHQLLKGAGVEDYSIYFDREHHVLFAVLRRLPQHTMEELQHHPIMRRWWAYMSDIMRTNPDGSPLAEPLDCMFHMD
ncbi:L-rhamnose mutarotase [Limnohabitans sp.]|jgi:L-rhamnose mutarotase|uniref:L-rhamnose mutarotase n=1 Tax=Limnohabitans sp. TaxID=1907725 RepID=UPI0037BF2061